MQLICSRQPEFIVPDDLLFKQAKFLLSAPDITHLAADTGIEVAFAGRSNAGKSSALNTLTQKKASQEPVKRLAARK